MSATPPGIEQFMGMTNQDLTARYARGVECLDRRAVQLSTQQADTAFLASAGVGRWPARVLVGHLADAELVFVHRMRRAVAEENPLLAIFDEQAFIDSGLYGVVSADPTKAVCVPAHSPPIAGFVAVIYSLRRWTSEWLASLSPKQWDRGCLHPERGPQTVRKIAEYTTWHLEHHAWYLNRKIARLLGGPGDEARS
ncbi:MAG: DinB family protein [Phycisphaerales bacterium]